MSIILPHPDEWSARRVYVVSARIGETPHDLKAFSSSQYKVAPYDRMYQLIFQLDELRFSGEVVWRCDTALPTGLVYREGRYVPK